jgi:phosphoribosylanthranilate isomerase
VLTIDEARVLRRRLPSWVAAVGLFVNATESRVATCAREVGLDVLQFHGDEGAECCAASAQGMPWWRAVRMRAQGDLLKSSDAFSGAEALLVDSFSAAYGGSGERFDWSWIPAQRPLPLVLSGGLDAESVGDGIRQVRPSAVDVSSGIQGANAREKSIQRMEAFVAAVLHTDHVLAHSIARSESVPPLPA